MKFNYSLGKMVIVLTFFFSFPGLTQNIKGSSNQGGINESNTYYFGLRVGAYPISYQDEYGSWKGYCNAFIETLKQRFYQKQIEIIPVTRRNRFTGKGDSGKELDAECGPNTITEGRQAKELKENGRDGKFSEPFAWTGAKFLLLAKKIALFDNQSELKQIKIGVIRGTTTKTLVETLYPSLIKNIVLLQDDKDGINKIENGEIDVYYNDELSSLINLQNSNNKEKYFISPELVNHEQHGIIVYHINKDKNRQLLNVINDLLEKAKIKTFGSSQLKILDNSEFQKFQEDTNLHENIKSDTFLSIRKELLWLLFAIIICGFLLLIFLGINCAIKSKYLSKMRIKKNNDSNHLDIQETRAGSSKFESSSLTHQVLQLINNIHFQANNDNAQGDNMPENHNNSNSSRNINVGGDFNLEQTGSNFNIGDISGFVSNTVQQLKDSEQPEAQELADIISQLQKAIENDSKLTDEQKKDALEALASIGEEAQKPPEERIQKICKFALSSLKALIGIATDTNILKEFLPQVSKLMGF
ncbi:MAG: transporter substrate-binding domain-containing protein [Tolypothrix brevis GSE-NOS-MK-07-07A]|jgi:ABC-type amino acid transport substrate-binding protein/gas vesicle protein|nr:transporter substrate-binding domain-containing protein [Tolypothrix brevis GSE-NOS-MK-07-07A]